AAPGTPRTATGPAASSGAPWPRASAPPAAGPTAPGAAARRPSACPDPALRLVAGQAEGVTLTRRDIQARLEAHGLAPSRALGQNFVVDPNTVRRIARLAEVGPGTPVVEIGAGLGSLTLALLEVGADVTAVEVDRHLLPALRATVEPAGARVVEGDALALDWSAVLAGHDRWVLVANLPYNVATPLVLDLLTHVPAIERMLVMVQREVGERLAAPPGSKDYGIPSVKA